MIKDITKKLDKICSLPRPSRNEVSRILKECYLQGKKDERKSELRMLCNSTHTNKKS